MQFIVTGRAIDGLPLPPEQALGAYCRTPTAPWTAMSNRACRHVTNQSCRPVCRQCCRQHLGRCLG
jgi:hypothetical protein